MIDAETRTTLFTEALSSSNGTTRPDQEWATTTTSSTPPGMRRARLRRGRPTAPRVIDREIGCHGRMRPTTRTSPTVELPAPTAVAGAVEEYECRHCHLRVRRQWGARDPTRSGPRVGARSASHQARDPFVGTDGPRDANDCRIPTAAGMLSLPHPNRVGHRRLTRFRLGDPGSSKSYPAPRRGTPRSCSRVCGGRRHLTVPDSFRQSRSVKTPIDRPERFARVPPVPSNTRAGPVVHNVGEPWPKSSSNAPSSKERSETSFMPIASAMSLKANSRSKKSDIIDLILEATGVDAQALESAAAPASESAAPAPSVSATGVRQTSPAPAATCDRRATASAR